MPLKKGEQTTNVQDVGKINVSKEIESAINDALYFISVIHRVLLFQLVMLVLSLI